MIVGRQSSFFARGGALYTKRNNRKTATASRSCIITVRCATFDSLHPKKYNRALSFFFFFHAVEFLTNIDNMELAEYVSSRTSEQNAAFALAHAKHFANRPNRYSGPLFARFQVAPRVFCWGERISICVRTFSPAKTKGLRGRRLGQDFHPATAVRWYVTFSMLQRKPNRRRSRDRSSLIINSLYARHPSVPSIGSRNNKKKKKTERFDGGPNCSNCAITRPFMSVGDVR
jgi:hypothetical protein